MMRNPTGAIRSFKTDKKGNVAITFGLMIIPMLGVMGSAVDFGRSVHAQRRMQTAVDAAATAAAAALTVSDAARQQIAKDFFSQNNSGSFSNGPHVEVEVNGANVKVTASAEVGSGFMKLFGVDGIPVEAKSEAGQTGRSLEVSMMIDLTGSMGWSLGGQKKIDSLKLAAADLMDIFFPNGATTSGQVRVAIAPMADYVNVGDTFAAAVTGLPAFGNYANLTNLKSTRNGPFSGMYSGPHGQSQPLGSQHGATPVNTSVLPGQVSGVQPGQTYASNHCLDPNLPSQNVAELLWQNTGKPLGIKVEDNSNGSPTPPPQVKTAYDTNGYYRTDKYDNDGNHRGWEYDDENEPDYDSNDWYIPLPAYVTGVQYLKYGNTNTDIGVAISVSGGSNGGMPAQLKYGQYKKVKGWNNSGFTYYNGYTTGWYVPVPASMQTTGGIDPNCTGTLSQPDQPTGKLISCVTERTDNQNKYTDEAPGTGGYVGPYNQTAPSKSTNKLNYSEDGKCYTAGRELPAIIPLTNDRTKLETFFQTATIGGATPGHLGHAWAWYMLSPKWQSIWPQESQPAAYDDEGVMKAAIIMTDGQYNTEYSSAASQAQAKMLCDNMRDQGIKVFTIGFGFDSNGVDNAAANMLRQCTGHTEGAYFFPYDSDSLRQAFKEIGAQLVGGTKRLVVMK